MSGAITATVAAVATLTAAEVFTAVAITGANTDAITFAAGSSEHLIITSAFAGSIAGMPISIRHIRQLPTIYSFGW